MLLPDEGPDFAACGAYDWDARKLRTFAWRQLLRRLPVPFRSRSHEEPEIWLAEIVMTLRGGTHAESAEVPMLLERLEQAARENMEVRKVLAKYLCEP
jgi:hypothetical protein